jgi:diguanylate cyclase
MQQKQASIYIGGTIEVNETITTKHLAQRAARRRSTYIAQAVSYLISAGILALYAYAGTINVAVSVVYLICGITATVAGLYLSEINFNDRFKDHYLTVPQTIVSMTIQLVAIYLAPQVGFYFIFILFIVLSFGALLMNALQTAIVWTYATVGLTILLLMTDKPVAYDDVDRARPCVGLCGHGTRPLCFDGSLWKFNA